MQDYVTLKWCFVVGFAEIELIVGSVYGLFRRLVSFGQVFSLGDLRPEYYIGSVVTLIIASLNKFRTIVNEQCTIPIRQLKELFLDRRRRFFERRTSWDDRRIQESLWLTKH